MIRMAIDAIIGDTWDTILTCPTCGSTDRDVFLPIIAPVMRCDNPWHEDRIIKKPRHKSGEAAARQTRIVTRVVKRRHEKVQPKV